MTVTTGRARMLGGIVFAVLSRLSAAHASPPEAVVVIPPAAVKAVPQRQVVLARRQFNFSRTPGFYELHLAPGVSAALRNERVVANDDYASSWSDRSTQDPGAAGRVEKSKDVRRR